MTNGDVLASLTGMDPNAQFEIEAEGVRSGATFSLYHMDGDRPYQAVIAYQGPTTVAHAIACLSAVDPRTPLRIHANSRRYTGLVSEPGVLTATHIYPSGAPLPVSA